MRIIRHGEVNHELQSLLTSRTRYLMSNRRSGCGGGGRGGMKPEGRSEVRLAALERNG